VANQSARPPDLAVAALAVLATVLVLSAMPASLTLAVAVFLAISWCIWLDHHPTP
jgi:hypothetical protein